jgi:ornithine--oxo-acid transaminase
MLGFEMVLPMNTGAEAVETAVKIARKWGYKVKGIPENKAWVFSAQENFHGRTVSTICGSLCRQYTNLYLVCRHHHVHRP